MESILDSFEIWSDAQGVKSRLRVKGIDNISLNGIARLRELILELAVRGKLVSQSINEEPSVKMIQKYFAENSEILNKRKFQKGNPSKFHVTAPYSLPTSWSWVRLGDISTIERGGSPRPIDAYLTTAEDGLNWIKIGDTSIGGKYVNSTSEKIRKEGLVKTRMVFPGDFLLTNSMSFGRPYITNIEGCIHDGWLRIHPPNILNKDYLYYLLSSQYVYKFFKSTAAGAVVQNLNSEKVRELPVPIPPLNEQKRIAIKVDELMVLCDELEDQKTNSLKTHHDLVKCLLENLTQSANAAALQKSWGRLAQYFDALFCTEDSVEQLKQTILQLAIMGKLVTRSPKDEPASILIERINNEKEKLVEDGTIKRETKLPNVEKNEEPFLIPKNWKWIRLGNITNKIGSGSTPRGGHESYTTSGIIFLRSQNIRDDRLDLSDVAYIKEETHEKMTGTKVYPKDILLNITGGSLGRSTIFPDGFEEANVSQHVTIIRPTLPESSPYLHLCIKSPYGQELIWGRQVGANREGLSKKVLELFEFPLPPLDEQRRIIKKVNELFALCDDLNKRIGKSSITKNNLASTILNLVS